jgi:hypothetical protein
MTTRYSTPSLEGVLPLHLDPQPASSWQDALADAVRGASESCSDIGGPNGCFVDIVLRGGWRPYTLLTKYLATVPGDAQRALRLLRWMASNSVVSIPVIRIPDATPAGGSRLIGALSVCACPFRNS